MKRETKVCMCSCHRVEKTSGGCTRCYLEHITYEATSPIYMGHL